MKEQEDVKYTEGGHRYIEVDGLKVRSDIVGQRLIEDGETFEEYKLRQKYVKVFEKRKKEGELFWAAYRGTYNKAKFAEVLKGYRNLRS